MHRIATRADSGGSNPWIRFGPWVVAGAPLALLIGQAYGAHPSFAFIDVGTASRERFRPEHAAGDPKRSVPLCTPQPEGPVPVAGLAFLARGDEVAATPVARATTVSRLLKEALFAADLLDADGHAVRLDGALALAAAVPA